MNNTNTDTVLKLSEALNTLIQAYEELQKENDALKLQKGNLEKELSEINNEKEELETNFDELNETTEKQETNINSMLGKIESLLGVKTAPKKELQDIVIEPKETETAEVAAPDESSEIEESIFNSPINNEVKKDEPEKEEDDKLDLNRMASLLNGFNR